MILGRPIAKLLDLVTGVLAFAAMIIVTLYYINVKFPFISNADSIRALLKWKDIAVFAVLGLCGLEFALRRSIIIFIVYIILVIVAVVFMSMAGVLSF